MNAIFDTAFLVTGAGGNLGSKLVDALATAGARQVVALSSRPEKIARTHMSQTNVRVMHNAELSQACQQERATLINCAFPTSTDPQAISDGIDFTNEVFSVACRSPIQAILNISSQSVYSQQRMEAATEATPVAPESGYAVAKYASEKMLHLAAGGRMLYSNIRLGSLVGPEYRSRVLNRFVAETLAGRHITIAGGRQVFGFLDVSDAAAGLAHALGSNPSAWQSTYNLGPSETGFDLRRLAFEVMEVAHQRGYICAPVFTDGGKWHSSALDSSRFQQDFGWQADTPMHEIVEAIFDSELELQGQASVLP